jgi:hypothetical protein
MRSAFAVLYAIAKYRLPVFMSSSLLYYFAFADALFCTGTEFSLLMTYLSRYDSVNGIASPIMHGILVVFSPNSIFAYLGTDTYIRPKTYSSIIASVLFVIAFFSSRMHSYAFIDYFEHVFPRYLICFFITFKIDHISSVAGCSKYSTFLIKYNIFNAHFMDKVIGHINNNTDYNDIWRLINYVAKYSSRLTLDQKSKLEKIKSTIKNPSVLKLFKENEEKEIERNRKK